MSILAANAAYDNASTLFLSRLEKHVISSIQCLHQIKYGSKDYLSLTNKNKHSLLHLATLCGYVDLVKILVQLECDVNQVDRNGFTALHFASWTGKVDIVKILIDKSDLMILNHRGKTAERLAAEAGHFQVMELFQQKKNIYPREETALFKKAVTYLLSSSISLSAIFTIKDILRYHHSSKYLYLLLSYSHKLLDVFPFVSWRLLHIPLDAHLKLLCS